MTTQSLIGLGGFNSRIHYLSPFINNLMTSVSSTYY